MLSTYDYLNRKKNLEGFSVFESTQTGCLKFEKNAKKMIISNAVRRKRKRMFNSFHIEKLSKFNLHCGAAWF